LFIIFDLDDTLIDTSAFIAPALLRKSLRFAREQGLIFDEAASAQLLEQHVRQPSSEMALKKFLEDHGATSSLILDTLQQYRTLLDPELDIPSVPYAKDVLEVLAIHRLAVVTIGREELQHHKLKKAGFFLGLFSKIIVTTERNKKIHYKALLEEYGHIPNETVVVGDRIEVDLKPAKELGCSTVRLMRGRGAYEQQQDSVVDFTIYDLRELPQIIERVKKNGYK
jgi:putative hydrolase of the HAD superfamily